MAFNKRKEKYNLEKYRQRQLKKPGPRIEREVKYIVAIRKEQRPKELHGTGLWQGENDPGRACAGWGGGSRMKKVQEGGVSLKRKGNRNVKGPRSKESGGINGNGKQ